MLTEVVFQRQGVSAIINNKELAEIYEYQNKKLMSLEFYPPFRKEISELRNKYGLDSDWDKSTVLGLLRHKMAYEVVASYDEFVNKLSRETKAKYNIVNYYDYIVLLYFIIYNKTITLKEIYKFIYTVEEDNYNISLDKLEKYKKDNTVKHLRNKLGVINIVDISDIVYNYTCFNKYLNCPEVFFMDEFLVDIKTVLDEYEILNYKNRWDYVLIFNYILYEDELSLNRDKGNELFQSLDANIINDLNKFEIASNPEMYELIDDNYHKGFKWDIRDNYYIKISKIIDKKVLDISFDKAKEEISNNLFGSKVSVVGLAEFYRNKFIYELMNRNKDLNVTHIFEKLINDCKYCDSNLINKMGFGKLYSQYCLNDIDKDLLRDTLNKMKKSSENNKDKFVKGKF